MALIDNLISYYKLDETSGTNAVDIHGPNDATANSSDVFTSSIAGVINTGADFTGNNVIKITNTPFAGLSAFSVSFWADINWANTATWGEFVGSAVNDNNFDWLVRKDGNNSGFAALLKTSSVLDIRYGTSLSNGLYHIVMTWDGSEVLLYVNAVERADGLLSGTMTDNDRNFQMGTGDGSNAGRYIENMIDEVGIWSRGLSPSEVTELYNSGDGLAYPFSVAVAKNAIAMGHNF